MFKTAIYVGVAIVILHGLIHLLGFVAYWPLGQIAELPYKTTLLGGRWDVGANGMRYFSLFWLAIAASFLGSVTGLALRQEWWLPLLGTAVFLSLVVCALDWSNAWRGAAIDLAILLTLLLAWAWRIQPRLG